MSPVFNQGPRPTCVACALAAAHEGERTAFKAAIEPVWWQLVDWGLAGPDGTLLRSAARALLHSGQCHADLWTYNDTLGYGTEQPPPEARVPPWTCADVSWIAIAHDGVEEEIEDALTAGHPVVLIIEVSTGFFTPEADGYIAVPPLTAPAEGYHAVVIVGAWTDATHGRVFLIRNSWGEFWGSGGYGLLPVSYLTNFGAEAARITV